MSEKELDLTKKEAPAHDQGASDLHAIIAHSGDWLKHLQTLSDRFSYLGIGADLAALPLIELWGLYRFLMRLSGGLNG